MTLKNVPIDTWMVVDVAFNGWNVVSTHASQNDAERNGTRAMRVWNDDGTVPAWHWNRLPSAWVVRAAETLASNSGNNHDVTIVSRGALAQRP